QSNQETTFAYPLTQAWPSACGQTKKQLLLILLLRHGLRLALGQSSALLILVLRHSLRLAVTPRNNFCLSSYSVIVFVLRSNQETTFAYPLTQAWPSSCARAKQCSAYPLTQAQPSSCGQTKKQLLLILLLRHSLRLAVKPRNNF